MTQFGIDALELSGGAETTSLREFVASWSRHPQPVLFAGAGFSFNAKPRPDLSVTSKFGSWNALINDLRDSLAGSDDGLRSRLTNDALRLAQIFEQHFGRPALLDAVLKHVPNDDFVPGEAHEKLRLIRWGAIVTTNYDDLIERAFHQARIVRRVISDHDLTQPRSVEDLLVLKLHGDLSARDSIVLTEEDYRRYPGGRPGISIKVRQLLVEHPLLFVGFSLTDPHFSMIDGWIRDTVHKLRLPAIAIMHTPSVPAERAMWQERGITTVQLAESENLARLFTALANEWSIRVADGRALTDERATIWELQQQASRIAASSDTDRTKQLAERLRSIIQNAGDEDSRNPEALKAIHWFAYGWHDVLRQPLVNADNASPSGSELTAGDVYIELTDGEQRKLLQLALESGIDKLRLSPTSTLDIQQELTANDQLKLTGDEMARSYLYKARILRGQGDTPAARQTIVEARRLCESARVRAKLSEEMREILFQEGDKNQMADELQNPPESEPDVFAMCRRGADYLLLGAKDSARGWYSRALERATNGDEKYSALWGVYACSYESSASPPEGARNREMWFRQELDAISPIERKRVEKTLALVDEAGQALLSDDNKQAAINRLESFLESARQMGWPHSSEHNVAYVIEVSARRAARLLMEIDRADRDEGDGAKDALQLLSRYGLAKDVHKLFTSDICERLATDLADVEWFRRFAKRHPTLPRANDAHTAAALRGVPLLPDSDIIDIISTIIARTHRDLGGQASSGDRYLEDWLDAIGSVQEHLPEKAALNVIELLTRCTSDSWAMFRLRSTFSFSLWRDQGFVTPGDEPTTKLAFALAAATDKAVEKGDSHWLRGVARIIGIASEASIFDPASAMTLRAALTSALQLRLQASKLQTYDATTLASALDSVERKGTGSTLALYAPVALRIVRDERRSSMLGRTLYLASRVVSQMPVRERHELLEVVVEVAESIISRGKLRGLIPPATAQVGEVLVALARALPRARSRILDVLRRLVDRDVAALPALSEVGGTSVATEVSYLATRALLSGQPRDHVLPPLATWFAKRNASSASSVVELVTGLAAAESRDTRYLAVSTIGQYMLAHSMPPGSRWFDLIATIAEEDQSYHVRARALDMLYRARTNATQVKRCKALSAKAAASVVAIERRLAPLLAGKRGSAPSHRRTAAPRRRQGG